MLGMKYHKWPLVLKQILNKFLELKMCMKWLGI